MYAISSTLLVMAYGGNQTYAGKANFYVISGENRLGETDIDSDTIVYTGSDFIIPSIKYGGNEIPSFTVINPSQSSGSYEGVVWQDSSWECSDDNVKPIYFEASFTHGTTYNINLRIVFSYGRMPMPISYSISGFYVKPTTETLYVLVGSQFGPYINENVTYDARLYTEDEQIKLDVTMNEYQLTNTAIGDLTIGSYTVKGLVYDEEKGGYYRDYTDDHIQFHFTSTNGLDGDYELKGNLLVEMNKTNIVSATNSFQPGNMPFPIVASFAKELVIEDSNKGNEDQEPTAIESDSVLPKTVNNVKKYMINGRLIIEKNGKKYSITGAELR